MASGTVNTPSASMPTVVISPVGLFKKTVCSASCGVETVPANKGSGSTLIWESSELQAATVRKAIINGRVFGFTGVPRWVFLVGTLFTRLPAMPSEQRF